MLESREMDLGSLRDCTAKIKKLNSIELLGSVFVMLVHVPNRSSHFNLSLEES
jgi:hypothetical protein